MATEISPGLERTLTSLAVAGGTTIHLTKPDGRFLRINKTGRALACYGSGHFIKNGQQATRPHQLPVQDIVSTDAATRTELQPVVAPDTTLDRNDHRPHRLLLALSITVLVGGVSVASAISSHFPKPAPAPEITTSTLTIDATQPDTTLETRESEQEPSSEPLETVSLPPLSISVKTPEPTQAPESKEPADRPTTRSHHAPTTAPRPEPAPTSAPRPTVQPAPTKKPEPAPEPARQLPSARVNGMQTSVTASGTSATFTTTVHTTGSTTVTVTGTVGGRSINLGTKTVNGTATFSTTVPVSAGSHQWIVRAGSMRNNGTLTIS